MMSDDIISQEEIEALLSGGVVDDNKKEEASSSEEIEALSDMEADTLGEIGNMSFGSAATALSSLLGQKVEITTPTTSIVTSEELKEQFVQPYVAVKVEYTEGLSGANLLVIKQSDAAIIADLMLGSDGLNPDPELSEIHLSAVQEAMNQMMGSAATSMSTIFNKKVDISPPMTDLMDVQEEQGLEYLPEESPLISVSFNLKVGDLIDSDIMQLFPIDFGKSLVSDLEQVMMGGTDEREQEVPQPSEEQVSEPAPVSPSPQVTEPMNEAPVQQQAPPLQQQQRPREPQPQVNVQQAQFEAFQPPQLEEEEAHNLNLLMDIPLEVTVELGRTTREVHEILEMSGCSIIELDNLAGEPVDILVNNRHIAKGEVVVIDENFGVRITDILSQTERMNNLK
mgnify:CR=1 FL=1